MPENNHMPTKQDTNPQTPNQQHSLTITDEMVAQWAKQTNSTRHIHTFTRVFTPKFTP